MAMLKMLKGRSAQREFSLDPDADGAICDIQIGRDAKRCDVVLTPRTVSRAHARLAFEDDHFVLYDLGSKAGTILNGGRLKPNTPYELRHRDLISICEFIFAFSNSDDSSDTGSSTEYVEFVDDHATAFSPAMDSSAESMAARAAANAMGKLAALMKLIRSLRSTVALGRLLEKTLDSLLTMFQSAGRGVIVLYLSETEGKRHTVTKSRSLKVNERVILNSRLLNEVIESRQAVISDDGRTNCVPLIDRNESSMGVIQLDAVEDAALFASDDIELLLVVALQVAFAVENAMLHEAAMQDRTLGLELKIAHEIQVSLLPAELPDIDGYDFFDYYAPAKHVGGDYYDYQFLPDNRLAFLIGDVSGKGVPAAMLMAKAATEFKVFLSTGLTPVEVVGKVNQRFAVDTPDGAFMTLVLAILDFANHRLQLVNAGHLRPLLRRCDGTVVEIGNNEAGLPLGILRDVKYEQTEFTLEPGEMLLLVTDGITEAQNEERKQYGSKRLIDLFSRLTGTAMEVGQAILDDIGVFVGGNAQSDDTCLMCIRRIK